MMRALSLFLAITWQKIFFSGLFFLLTPLYYLPLTEFKSIFFSPPHSKRNKRVKFMKNHSFFSSEFPISAIVQWAQLTLPIVPVRHCSLMPNRRDTKWASKRTRPDTRLSQSRAGGQGPYLRSLDHLGRSSEAKDRIKTKKVKCDGRTDGPTKRGVKSRSTRLKKCQSVESPTN